MAMTNEDYQHFVCVVAGDNPKQLMSQYDKNKIVQPYVVYKYKDAKDIKDKYIKTYECFLNNDNANTLNLRIAEIKEMSPHDFFVEFTENMDHDKKTGDAISNKNKDGKWSSCNIGKMFSSPFLTKDGRDVYQAKKIDIDWNQIHLYGQEIYKRAWEMVMENSPAVDENERQIFLNMKDNVSYFKKFETKENYILSNTAFWGYAFVSENTGWLDADEEDQFVWMKNYYDMFIKNLPDDTLLTIYECRK